MSTEKNLTSKEESFYKREGFLVRENIFSKSEVFKINDALERAASKALLLSKTGTIYHLDGKRFVDSDYLTVQFEPGLDSETIRVIEPAHQLDKELKKLKPDQTLCIQSGKPVYIAQTHLDAPRVIIANSNLVPRYANQKTFGQLDLMGLAMDGQMTAGSWSYTGPQGILQGTYETFMAAAEKHYGEGSNLKGKLVLTAGIGGMGGAQPLAVKMAGGVFIGCDVIVGSEEPWKCDDRNVGAEDCFFAI